MLGLLQGPHRGHSFLLRRKMEKEEKMWVWGACCPSRPRVKGSDTLTHLSPPRMQALLAPLLIKIHFQSYLAAVSKVETGFY